MEHVFEGQLSFVHEFFKIIQDIFEVGILGCSMEFPNRPKVYFCYAFSDLELLWWARLSHHHAWNSKIQECVPVFLNWQIL